MLGLTSPGWFNCPGNWERATLIIGKMSGEKNLFNVAVCGNLVLLCWLRSCSCTALYRLYAAVPTSEQLGSADHWGRS